jgi:hypothetical protein
VVALPCALHPTAWVTTEVRTFRTTTADLLRVSERLAVNYCMHVAMEAIGIYWKPLWHIPEDGEFELVLANAAQVKNVPGRQTDVNDAMRLTDTAGAWSDPGELLCRMPKPGAQANNWFVSGRATCCAQRHLRTPTSNWTVAGVTGKSGRAP